MRLHYFFIDQPLLPQKEIFVSDSLLLNQWRNVLRFKTGDQLILLDNSGQEFVSHFVSLFRDEAKIFIDESRAAKNIPTREVTLFASLAKRDSFEWMLEKGTEIGVSNFVPIETERSEKKSLNIERSKKIIREASEQAHRGKCPEICEPVPLAEILERNIPIVAFHPDGEKFSFEKIFGLQSVGIIIGPEGGFSERELELIKKKKIKIFSLGPMVLRAETAAVAAASLFLLA